MAFALDHNNPLESRIEAKAVKEARARGWIARKLGQGGEPDRQFVKDGRYVEIEFKRPGEPPTARQIKRHRDLRRQGVNLHVCDSWRGAIAVLDAAEL